MSQELELRIAASQQDLLRDVGDAIGAVLQAALQLKGIAHFVLTGGTIGIAVLDHIPRDAVDWERVHIWWGDERFVPEFSPDRNCVQAEPGFLNRLPLLAQNIHRVASANDVATVNDATDRYAEELAHWSTTETGSLQLPQFDIVLLGMGPDTHVASLFPSNRNTMEDSQGVIAVLDSPKPPAQRVSLTFSAINSAQYVWLLVSDSEKAGAVKQLVETTDDPWVPASCVHGQIETALWTDEQSARLIQ